MAIAYTQEYVDECTRKGYWDPHLLTADICDENGRKFPNDEAAVDSVKRLTWAQVKQQTDRLALSLLEMGFKHDDVLQEMLYSCVDFYLLRIACEKAGVVLSACASTFRHAELKPVLEHVQAKGIVIPGRFRNFDYFQMIKEIEGGVPSLKHIIVIGPEVPAGAISFEDLLQNPLEGNYPADYLQKTKFGGYESTFLLASSGSTGTPKVAEWTNPARIFAGKKYVERLKYSKNDILAVIAPFNSGACLSSAYRAMPMVGGKLVFLEHFTPEDACALMEREKATCAGLVPTLATRLVNFPDLEKYDLRSLRFVVSSTAPLPHQVAAELERKLGCRVVQAYGSIESASITIHPIDDPPEVRTMTVGRPFEGVEVKILDEQGRELPRGEAGEVWVRGPSCPSRYYKNPELSSKIYRDGWLFMNEMAKLDDQGNIVLVGRKRDTITRGGQKFFPKEIEELLVKHPHVAEAAVVGMPDPDMGERACAFIVPKKGMYFTFEGMIAYLKEQKVAMFKLPERLEIIGEMPLVAGGIKINKRALEEEIKRKLAQEEAI